MHFWLGEVGDTDGKDCYKVVRRASKGMERSAWPVGKASGTIQAIRTYWDLWATVYPAGLALNKQHQ